MLEQLKRFDADRTSLEDALALSAQAEGLRTQYDKHGIEVPTWLDDKQRALARYISASRADVIQMRIAETRSALATLETPAEKRKRLQAQLDELNELAGATS